ncbi:MAG: cation-translocating P-type ATPase [Ruminococcus sp.]|jgi:Ca2+-transporting ATPase|nr:cation-translocating P-type ATPase [Ruminococcus sp.]
MVNVLDKSYTRQSIIKGLSSEQAEEALSLHGENTLADTKKTNAAKVFFTQFRDIMVLILLAATAVSVFLGEVYDAGTIIIIVLANAIIGFTQEMKTEKTLQALKEMAAPAAKVYRDNRVTVIPASELVPRDVVLLEAGDRIPADCCLRVSKGLYAEESILTGESHAVGKSVTDTQDTDNAIGKPNILYMGTVITKGNAEATVIATGLNTQMGKISGLLKDIEPELTPLQKRLAELGKAVALICLIVCIVVTLAGILRGEPVLAMLMTGITIAIAAIPEGLPATVTIALALAVRRMLRKNALVHKLHSVETLGCAEVICTDKTGTVTENKMTVSKVFAGGKFFDISGTGHKMNGSVTVSGQSLNPMSDKSLSEICVCGVICENSKITPKGANVSRARGNVSGGEWEVFGDPTETAILVAAAKCGFTAENVDFPKIDEIPFDSDTRYMAVLASRPGGNTAFLKGSADVILNKCSFIMTNGGAVPLTMGIKRKILKAADEMAADALRVLAFAEKECKNLSASDGGNTFLGLMGMIDPPRAEAKQAVKLCKAASIKTVMITGDHKNTAAAVARQAGILKEGDLVVTGNELEKMSDVELEKCVLRTSVFARVSPADKLRIVRAFKKSGKIVAMTGDGVNDAPAVKEADIGVAMGITGTDVTKQAADLVLLDDNFATLVSAVEQGRGIYSNIRKFVRYLLSCNIGEVLTMFLGIIMGMPMVLLPTQILLVNLVTDGLPAVALGIEPVSPDEMKKPPRKASDSFFAGGLMGKIIFRGILIGLLTLGVFSVLITKFGDVNIARTGALLTLVLSQLMHVFECKSERRNIFTVDYKNNPKLIFAVLSSLLIIAAAIYIPALQLIFSTVALSPIQILISVGFAVSAPILQAIFGNKR